MYIYLFEKASDLESDWLGIYIFYYLHEKYDNSISSDLSRFKITVRKIESIEIYFFSLVFSD
jgi:hypothetical protein